MDTRDIESARVTLDENADDNYNAWVDVFFEGVEEGICVALLNVNTNTTKWLNVDYKENVVVLDVIAKSVYHSKNKT